MDETLQLQKRINENFCRVLTRLISEKYPRLQDEAELLFGQFIEAAEPIYQIAPQYDYNDIPSNGKRSLLKFAQNFLLRAHYAINSVDDVRHIFIGTEYFILALNYSMDQHNARGDTEKTNEMTHDTLVTIENNVEKYMRTFLRDDYIACNCPDLKIVLKFFFRLCTLALSPSTIRGLLAFVLPHNWVVNPFVENCKKSTPQLLARFIRIPDIFISRMVTRMVFLIQNPIAGPSIERKSVTLDVASPYLIGVDEKVMYTKLFKRLDIAKTKIRFRVLSTKGHFQGKVILYVHGGGFVGPSADSLEDLYIADWALGLPGATIVNFDYSFAPEVKFPTQVQELLDCYLWLQSGSPEVKEVLGFIPSEIIFAGDSAGGNFILALTVLLNDIHQEFSSTRITFPKALVGMFGKYHISKKMHSSHFLSISDQLVSFTFLLRMASYCKFRWYNQHSLNNNSDAQKTWTLVSIDSALDHFVSNKNMDPDPSHYLQPLMYPYFNSEPLKAINLYLLGIDACPLLDETILLAKKWCGQVKYIHLDDTCHGSLYFHRWHPSATKSMMKSSIDLLFEALSC